MAVRKPTERLMTLLNGSVAREMQVSIQYMWQHVLWKGVKGYSTRDAFKTIAITEMKHAEMIAERLVYLGGKPTVTPSPITIGNDLKGMLAQDIKDEEDAIKLYNEVIETADKENDVVTAQLFREILSDEEGHHDTFTSINEEV